MRGTDYVEIPGGQPFAPLDGQVEVVEVFAYSCGHCAAFDPLVSAWKRRLPADVRFTMLPAVFYDQDNFPKAFFAAESVGVLDRVHTPLFNALHTERRLRPNASTADIIAYMARHGADADARGRLTELTSQVIVKPRTDRIQRRQTPLHCFNEGVHLVAPVAFRVGRAAPDVVRSLGRNLVRKRVLEHRMYMELSDARRGRGGVVGASDFEQRVVVGHRRRDQ